MKIARVMGSGLKWAALHFLACILIVPTTLKVGAAGWGVTGVLTLLTKILYFPILGLALYPRYWFPGHWIYIPIALNSLIWGGVLAVFFIITRRLRRNAHPDA